MRHAGGSVVCRLGVGVLLAVLGAVGLTWGSTAAVWGPFTELCATLF